MDANNELFSLTEELIKIIKTAIHNPKNEYQNGEEWQKPQNWNNVVKNLGNILTTTKDKNKLAQQLIGLAKNLDYYFLGWAGSTHKKKIQNLITSIVIKSSKIISKARLPQVIINACGQHEDKACIMTALSGRCRKIPRIYRSDDKKNSLPKDHVVNFLATPCLKRALDNLRLYRIYGKTNSPYGSYWLVGDLPQSRKEWRKLFAVSEKWNKGTHYLELYFKSTAWFGLAASQIVPNEECILVGGGHQVWIPPNKIKNIMKCKDIREKLLWQ
jgi:hypothetical protein